jgi:hypothetical protein
MKGMGVAMRRAFGVASMFLVVIGGMSGSLSAAQACSIDGIPSISANGQLAVRNLTVPTGSTFLTWAPFVFHRAVARNHPVRLSEDMAKIARVLTSAELHGHWRWTFGDGQTASGQGGVITHRYARAGQYRITVATYDPLYNGWKPFDSVDLTIHS